MLDRLSSNLAANLRRLREARELTQQQLSEASGVPRPTLAHLETGDANPTLGVLARVAGALGVGMEELVAAPTQRIAHHPAPSLSQQTHQDVTVRVIFPDAPAGVVVERWEFPVRAELERGAGRQADRTCLACERGEVEVSVGKEQTLLRTGDVGVISGGTGLVCVNGGRGTAVIYCIKLGVWAG